MVVANPIDREAPPKTRQGVSRRGHARADRYRFGYLYHRNHQADGSRAPYPRSTKSSAGSAVLNALSPSVLFRYEARLSPF
jgi:hypothetical protein